ncbi:hypothetical protein D3C73_1384800 [compost metagenome]
MFPFGGETLSEHPFTQRFRNAGPAVPDGADQLLAVLIVIKSKLNLPYALFLQRIHGVVQQIPDNRDQLMHVAGIGGFRQIAVLCQQQLDSRLTGAAELP